MRQWPSSPSWQAHRVDSIGTTVNAVTPGLITTEMTAAIPEKFLTEMNAQIQADRAGRPEEVAQVVHFLVADASSPTSPDRCGASTAAWTCDPDPTRQIHPGPASVGRGK